jgi:hypothetical protein
MILDDRLLAFVVPSPKRRDLHRDGRYAFHSYPPADNEDAFSVMGRARLVIDRVEIGAARARYLSELKWSDPPDGFGEQELFEFLIDRCLLTRTNGHGDPHPRHHVWRT